MEEDSGTEKPENVLIRTRWAPPHPGSVYTKAKEEMDRVGNAVLARAMRELALVEANDREGMVDQPGIVEWLDQHISEVTWLKHHIQHDLDLQRDIPALLPENLRKQCEVCGRWFVPQRSTAKYDSDYCRVKAARARKK